MSKPTEPEASLRILCFGDSLSAGYHSWGFEYHPYATRLEDRLKHRYPSRDIDIIVNGLPADTVIDGKFRSRLESELGNSAQYNWIVILGGTNDLGWGREIDDILKSLEMVWDMALESGANVLALTVPANQGCNSARGQQRLQDLNGKILVHQKDSFFTADLYTLIPWPVGNFAEQNRIWDDGLHFTPEGYDMMGDLIADRLIGLLE